MRPQTQGDHRQPDTGRTRQGVWDALRHTLSPSSLSRSCLRPHASLWPRLLWGLVSLTEATCRPALSGPSSCWPALGVVDTRTPSPGPAHGNP